MTQTTSLSASKIQRTLFAIPLAINSHALSRLLTLIQISHQNFIILKTKTFKIQKTSQFIPTQILLRSQTYRKPLYPPLSTITTYNTVQKLT